MATSTLNPNAPLFVLLAYQMVEDFSDEWWALVKSSPWFRDYWLQERYHDDDTNQFQLYDVEDFLPEDESALFDVFSDHPKEEYNSKEIIPRGMMWNKGRVVAEKPRYAEKVPKNVNVKVSPTMIYQPK